LSLSKQGGDRPPYTCTERKCGVETNKLQI